jgi:hypothetical protein
MTPLERITARVNRNGDVNDPTTPHPLLTLAEFFDGNQVAGSIGCNLTPTPTPAEFYELFKGIAARPDVADIRVQVSMFDDPEWPFSDTVWIITSAEPEQVVTWFTEEMRPDECSSGWSESAMTEFCPIPTGMQPIACWWD